MHRLIYTYIISCIVGAILVLVAIFTPPGNAICFYFEIPLEIIWVETFLYLALRTFPKKYSFAEKLLWGILYLYSFGLLYPFAFKIALKSFNISEQVKKNALFLVISASGILAIPFLFAVIYPSLQH